MWFGDEEIPESKVLAELQYGLARIHAGERNPWIYVVTGELAAMLQQDSLALECYRRLDPFDEPARELRERLRSRIPRLQLPRIPASLRQPATEILASTFAGALDRSACRRPVSWMTLAGGALLGALSALGAPGPVVAALAIAGALACWHAVYTRAAEDLQEDQDLPPPAPDRFRHWCAAVLPALPLLWIFATGSPPALLLLPLACGAAFHLLTRPDMRLPRRSELPLAALASLLLSVEALALAFAVWAGGTAAIAGAVVLLHGCTFLAVASRRILVRRMLTEDAYRRSREDLRLRYAELPGGLPDRGVAEHTRISRIPAAR